MISDPCFVLKLKSDTGIISGPCFVLKLKSGTRICVRSLSSQLKQIPCHANEILTKGREKLTLIQKEMFSGRKIKLSVDELEDYKNL